MTELTSTHLKLRVTIFLYQKCSNTIKSFIFVETPYVQEKLNNKSSTTGNEDHPPPDIHSTCQSTLRSESERFHTEQRRYRPVWRESQHSAVY